MTDPARLERATGALVGSVVGDALGAPFEFGPSGRFGQEFPQRELLGRGEMIGSGMWRPAEWTDDTQMGLLVAQSLVDMGGLDEADLFRRFQAWVVSGPKDVGIQTRSVLTSGSSWDEAAAAHFASGQHAAGNGSLMRATPGAIYFARSGRDATMDAARRISALTHGDPAAGEGCAIFHELIRLALEGQDLLDHVDEVLGQVPPGLREAWALRLDPDYEPMNDPLANGAVWPALGSALWALRTTDSFEAALRVAIDLGGDTDTVACITGGLAGAHYGIGAIPSRWTTHLHGQLIGHTDSGLHLEDLQRLARDLLAGGVSLASAPPPEHTVEPSLVFEADQIYAASFPGVAAALAGGRLAKDAQIFSLSRTFGQLDAHPSRNQVWLIDQDKPGCNRSIDLVLDDVIDTMVAARAAGRPIVVHCHGGRSRTGLVLRAWALSQTPTMTVAQATTEVTARWPHLDTWNRSFDLALESWAARRRLRSA